jgi:hypothetical protein
MRNTTFLLQQTSGCAGLLPHNGCIVLCKQCLEISTQRLHSSMQAVYGKILITVNGIQVTGVWKYPRNVCIVPCKRCPVISVQQLHSSMQAVYGNIPHLHFLLEKRGRGEDGKRRRGGEEKRRRGELMYYCFL